MPNIDPQQTVPMVEFRLPHGARHEINLPIASKEAHDHAHKLLKDPRLKECQFECEVLTTGDAHFTFSSYEIGEDLAALIIFRRQWDKTQEMLAEWILKLDADKLAKRIESARGEDETDS